MRSTDRVTDVARIRDSKYFQSACAKVLELRREWAEAKDYEQLDVRARELWQVLAGTPLVAASDPLPEAFAATLGRLLPIDGRVGVALLLTLVIEIMSCFGLAALRALGGETTREAQSVRETLGHPHIGGDPGIARDLDRATEKLPQGLSRIIPGSSLTAANGGISSDRHPVRDERAEGPSNIIPLSAARSRDRRTREGTPMSPISMGRVSGTIGNHVPEFVRQCLTSALGSSLGASELRATYEAWCADLGYEPVSRQKLGAELKGLGFAKWKSCGLIRYRGLQLVA